MATESLLTTACVYLGAAVISVPIAKRLGLGSVLGYLIAGMLIGPFCLGLVGHEKDVLHFAEFGVVMMLFLVGLELKPARLWQLRGPILGVGGLQVGLTIGVLMLFALMMNTNWQSGLIIGMVLCLSSTAIVLQSLSEKGMMKRPAGERCFSVLLFQDIAVIPMLALIPLLASLPSSKVMETATDGHGIAWIDALPGWAHALVVVGAIVALIVGGHYLLRPAFRFIATTRLREVFTASALLLVVGIAWLMQQIGLSPALGTFLAGVLLAESEFRHELEVDIEPFKGLLLGLFFISVGAGIDFDLIMDSPWTLLGLTLSLVLVKFGILLGLARMMKMESTEAFLFALALAQAGEFGFVLLSFAEQAQALPLALIKPLTAVIALSMLATPGLLLFYEYVLMPRLNKQTDEPRPADKIDPQGKVIVAGFGRFGQIVGRLLIANEIPITVLDHCPQQIDTLRKFGHKVFYGDAARHDLLRAAGADDARLLIITIDEKDKVLEIVESCKKHFPHLPILVRAYDRNHAYALHEIGVDHIYRETFGSALEMGKQALTKIGFHPYRAERAGQIFKIHDDKAFKDLAQLWGDDHSYGVAYHQHAEDLLRLLKSDEEDPELHEDHAWDSGSSIEQDRKPNLS